MVNGRFYQFLKGGRAVTPDPSLPLPFAIMTHWHGGDVAPMPARQRAAVRLVPGIAAIDALLPTTDAFYALVLTGTWSVVHARTFKKQCRRTGRSAPRRRTLYTLTERDRGRWWAFASRGTSDSLSVANYHLHFVIQPSGRPPRRPRPQLHRRAGRDAPILRAPVLHPLHAPPSRPRPPGPLSGSPEDEALSFDGGETHPQAVCGVYTLSHLAGEGRAYASG